MIKLDNEIIIIGDSHWGLRKFNLDVLRNQLKVFHEQIFPYMKEKNIKTIFSLGDLLDNRTTANIIWLETLKKEFFDVLKENGFILYELLGNHDIYLRESREYSLVQTLSDIYPENFKIFKDREMINIGDKNIYVVPWITKNETLLESELQEADYAFMHAEVRNFAMVPGHKDTKSELTEGFFKNIERLKGVYSGHYHLKNNKGFFKYLGSLTQMNWSDYDDHKAFYHFNADLEDLQEIENTSSKKFVKVKYNDEENTDRNIEVKGLFKYSKLLTDEEFEEILPILNKHDVKTFINKHKDNHYEELLYKMKKADIKGSIVNNQNLSELIGTGYVISEDVDIEQKDTKTLIIETLKEANPDLLPLLNELFSEVQTEMSQEI